MLWLIGIATLQPWDDYDRRWRMHDGVGWAGWLILVLLLLLFAGMIATLVLLVLRSGQGGTPSTRHQTSPARPAGAAQQLLDERYARGEIDEEEYLHRRAVLRGR